MAGKLMSVERMGELRELATTQGDYHPPETVLELIAHADAMTEAMRRLLANAHADVEALRQELDEAMGYGQTEH